MQLLRMCNCKINGARARFRVRFKLEMNIKHELTASFSTRIKHFFKAGTKKNKQKIKSYKSFEFFVQNNAAR